MNAPAARENAVIRELRRRIVSGDLSPGSRFPTREQLQHELGVSWSPIHSAFNQLKEEGFVVTNGKGGTTVASNPPHLFNYALTFPMSQQDSRFWTALRTATDRIVRDEDRNIVPHLLVPRDSNRDDNARLERDVVAHRIAGLILVWMDGQVSDDSALFTQMDMPRVIWRNSECEWPAVSFDQRSFHTTALDHVLAAGRRRIAHLGIPRAGTTSTFAETLKKRGITFPAYLDQRIGASLPESARGVIHLLMNLGADQRPDALIISDDHLVEHVQAGLLDAGVRVPDDVMVVAHCNFPLIPPRTFPIIFIGFDCAEAIRVMVQRIDQQRAGLPTPAVTLLPARFESLDALMPRMTSTPSATISGAHS